MEVAYFGVFDGHNGEDCSEYLSHELHSAVLASPLAFLTNPLSCITHACLDTDNNVRALAQL